MVTTAPRWGKSPALTTDQALIPFRGLCLGFLNDLVFCGTRPKVFRPLLFDIVTAVSSFRGSLLILFAVATMPCEGHCLKSLFCNLEPASLAHAVVRFVHSP